MFVAPGRAALLRELRRRSGGSQILRQAPPSCTASKRNEYLEDFFGRPLFCQNPLSSVPRKPGWTVRAESEDSESLRKPPPETSSSSDWQVEDDSPCPFSRLQTNLFSWFVLCETNGNVRTFSADLINFGKCRFYREVRTRFTTFVKTG